MDVFKIAAFSHNNQGGNPAGVVMCTELPSDTMMLKTAKNVGYSETAFLKPVDGVWRIRYFAPEMEVPFCGHATIASGAVLGRLYGQGTYKLVLNHDEISVSTSPSESSGYFASLHSPNTWSKKAPDKFVEQLVEHFNFNMSDIDQHFPASIAFAGAKHLIIALRARETLSKMSYDFMPVKTLMKKQDLATIDLIWIESDDQIHSRNPFAPGGIYEDPATGAAAAALAGYLRDIRWKVAGSLVILQGQDMGMPSRLIVTYTNSPGERVQVGGETREIIEANA